MFEAIAFGQTRRDGKRVVASARSTDNKTRWLVALGRRSYGIYLYMQSAAGTGVVIVDSGLILTNLHVVGGAQRLKVVFWDGTESEAAVTGARVEIRLADGSAATPSRSSAGSR